MSAADTNNQDGESQTCTLHGCSNELTANQKKFCSRDCHQKHQSRQARRKGNKTGPVEPKVGSKPSGDGKPLTPQQEKFCQFYTGDQECAGNATQSYIKAYNIDVGGGSEQTSNAAARKRASELLTNRNIKARINAILTQRGLNDQFVDSQLQFLITQHEDWNVKLKAIKEYNRLNNRIKESDDSDVYTFFEAVYKEADEIESKSSENK